MISHTPLLFESLIWHLVTQTGVFLIMIQVLNFDDVEKLCFKTNLRLRLNNENSATTKTIGELLKKFSKWKLLRKLMKDFRKCFVFGKIPIYEL